MQVILTQLIELFVIASVTLFIHQFVRGLLYTPQPITIVESPVVGSVIPASYATLDWVVRVDNVEAETVDVVALARQRQPQANLTPLHNLKTEPTATAMIDISSLGIRELKKLASQRKIKGYSTMRKAELLLQLNN